MADKDEFVTLAESKEPDLNKYIKQLDKYLQERYSDQLKKESLLKKMKKSIGLSCTFTTLYEKALKLSKKLSTQKYNIAVTKCFLDLIEENKRIDDEWVNSDEIQKAAEIIRERIKKNAIEYIKKEKELWTVVKLLYEIKIKNLKKSGKEKNKEGQTLKEMELMLKNSEDILQIIQKNIIKLGFKDELLNIEQIRNKLNSFINDTNIELTEEEMKSKGYDLHDR